MLKFNQYIQNLTKEVYYLEEGSKEGKNTHLEHIDELVWNGGAGGIRSAIQFLDSIVSSLSGGESKYGKSIITTKFDGAPAVVAGINPENGKFFVGTKGVFANKPKLNYTNADIDHYHPGEGLNKKLKVALKYFPSLNIKGILQGDMMFTREDLHATTINGEPLITFQPNTIVYAVPTKSELARQIKAAQVGVIWHTNYTGKTIADIRASFNVNVGQLTPSKTVWFRDASIIDATGAATFTAGEIKEIRGIYSRIGKTFNQIDGKILNMIANTPRYQIEIKAWNNIHIRQGIIISNTIDYVKGLIGHIKTKPYKNEMERKDLLNFIVTNQGSIKLMFDVQNLLNDAKLKIISKLQKIESIPTFLKTNDGFRVTAPEGFVAINQEGGVTKLVDRLEFSRANFTAEKSWK